MVIKEFALINVRSYPSAVRVVIRTSLTLLDPLLMNFRAQVSHHHSPCRAAVLRQFTGFRGLFDWQAGVRRFVLFIYGLRPIAGCVFSMCVFI